MEDHFGEGCHAVGAEHFKAGELGLDDRHERRDDINHIAAKAGVDGGEVLGIEGGVGAED